ncbi:hypothetical protein [Oricola thermophila]|uniref:Uncharacterized protein n=1 Tax=Oricola thermophila TaxID=2742145 RepID=A0A6N1VMR6_9HYPH|nr:hypothetical protein [Oricola thermophila]QKV20277.1 hypothetical protein HTY61_18365 [Oricola thermophila]
MAEHKLEITTDVPNIRHTIHFGDGEFEMEIDGGEWFLRGKTSEIEVDMKIGRRRRWQDAMRDAMIFIEASTK